MARMLGKHEIKDKSICAWKRNNISIINKYTNKHLLPNINQENPNFGNFLSSKIHVKTRSNYIGILKIRLNSSNIYLAPTSQPPCPKRNNNNYKINICFESNYQSCHHADRNFLYSSVQYKVQGKNDLTCKLRHKNK